MLAYEKIQAERNLQKAAEEEQAPLGDPAADDGGHFNCAEGFFP